MSGAPEMHPPRDPIGSAGYLLGVARAFTQSLEWSIETLKTAAFNDHARALEEILELHRRHHAQINAMADRLVVSAAERN